MIERSQLRAARIFGITYLLSLATIMIAFSRFYAPYLAWENGQETARRLISHEDALRLYLAGAFLHGAAMVVLSTALYIILRPINANLALFATLSRFIYIVFWFLLLLNLFGALHLLEGPARLQSFGSENVTALAGLQIDSSRDAYYIGLTFNALGSALFAWVFFESCYIPRSLALWGILGALYEGICGFAYLIRPNFGQILSANWYELPLMTFEVLLSLWLLFRGLSSPEKAKAPSQG